MERALGVGLPVGGGRLRWAVGGRRAAVGWRAASAAGGSEEEKVSGVRKVSVFYRMLYGII